jgi:putative phosphoesterase
MAPNTDQTITYAANPNGSGTDTLWVRANDGTAWGAWKAFHVNAPVDHAPIVATSDFTATHNQNIAASSLFSATDADNDALTVTAISGNVDEGVLPPGFEPQRTIELYGVRIFMIHILGHPLHLNPAVQTQISSLHPDVLIFGHSHQPFVQRIGSALFFNPGSAGPKRFSLPRCVGILKIDNGQPEARLVPL